MNSTTSLELNDDELLELGRLSIGPGGDHEPLSMVSKALLTQDGMHILIQSKDFASHGIVTSCLIFDISVFDVNGDGAETIKCNLIPAQLEAIIEIPLGILPGSRLAFLDQDLWMCTYELGPVYNEGALQRHYFIPRDWVTTDNLEQCCLMEDGTFLCPREDKVAAIWCSFEAGGFESV